MEGRVDSGGGSEKGSEEKEKANKLNAIRVAVITGDVHLSNSNWSGEKKRETSVSGRSFHWLRFCFSCLSFSPRLWSFDRVSTTTCTWSYPIPYVMLPPHSQVPAIKIVTFITRLDSARFDDCCCRKLFFFLSLSVVGVDMVGSTVGSIPVQWVGTVRQSTPWRMERRRRRKRRRCVHHPPPSSSSSSRYVNRVQMKGGRRRRLMKKKKKKKSDVTRKRQKANDPATPTTTTPVHTHHDVAAGYVRISSCCLLLLLLLLFDLRTKRRELPATTWTKQEIRNEQRWRRWRRRRRRELEPFRSVSVSLSHTHTHTHQQLIAFSYFIDPPSFPILAQENEIIIVKSAICLPQPDAVNCESVFIENVEWRNPNWRARGRSS